MTSLTFFLCFVPILTVILLIVNFLFAEHKPNRDKDSQFECGFSSFTEMSRLPFSISFFVYALLFLLFDLEILLVYPYVVSNYNNSSYGLIVMLIFFILLTIGFVFELGRKALQIDSRQSIERAKLTNTLGPITHKHILPLYGYIRFLMIKYYILYNLLIARIIVYIISIIFNVYLIDILYASPIYCAFSPEPVRDDDNCFGYYEINRSGNTDNSNTREQINQPKRRPLRIWYEMFFTMGEGERNLWFNQYNAEDRQVHISAVKRLDITKQVWNELCHDERVETRILIDKTVKEMREQEYRDMLAAAHLQKELLESSNLQQEHLDFVQPQKEQLDSSNVQREYMQSSNVQKECLDSSNIQEYLESKSPPKRKRGEDIAEGTNTRSSKKLKVSEWCTSLTGFTYLTDNKNHDPWVGSSKFDYSTLKKLTDTASVASDPITNDNTPVANNVISNSTATTPTYNDFPHPNNPLTSDNLYANSGDSPKYCPGSPFGGSSSSGSGTSWSCYSSLNGNETPRTMEKKLEGIQNSEYLKIDKR